jgi:hypothetical protein
VDPGGFLTPQEQVQPSIVEPCIGALLPGRNRVPSGDALFLPAPQKHETGRGVKSLQPTAGAALPVKESRAARYNLGVWAVLE